jgi:hypothetical protein
MKVTKDDAVADDEDNTDATVLTDTVDVLEEAAVRVGVNITLLVPVIDGVDVPVGDLDLVLVTVTVREGVCERLATRDFEPLLVTDAVELLVRVIDGVDVPVGDLDLVLVTVTVRDGVCERLATIVDNDFETLAVADAVEAAVDCTFLVRVTDGVLDSVPDFDGLVLDGVLEAVPDFVLVLEAVLVRVPDFVLVIVGVSVICNRRGAARIVEAVVGVTLRDEMLFFNDVGGACPPSKIPP